MLLRHSSQIYRTIHITKLIAYTAMISTYRNINGRQEKIESGLCINGNKTYIAAVTVINVIINIVRT